ncbi:MAG TPA: MFS transporter [Methanocorpusculum sp.]|nr:MFS transporter [Methanocorpusculum sp.]
MTELSRTRQNLILLVTSIGTIVNPLLGTMIILAMPIIGTEFTISAHDLGWLSTAYILANAIALVPAAWIVDKIGCRKSYFIGTLIVGISCLLSIFAPSFSVLLTLRVTAGLGISFVMITSIAILTRIFPKSKRGFVIGINTTMVYVGLTLGPFLGGILADNFGWQSIFIITVPMIVSSGILVMALLNREFKEPVARFDLIGALLYSAATFCLMYGLSTITDDFSIVLAGIGLVIFIIFICYELREKHPVLHISLFAKNRRFARSSYAALLNYAASYAVTYMLSLYLQSVGQLTASEAGLILLVQTLIQVIGTPIAGKLADKMDSKYLATGGMILTFIGLLLLSNLGMSGASNRGYLLIIQIFLGIGVAFFSAPNSSTIMSSVGKKEYSAASSTIAVVRQYGMLISMAICMSAISICVGSSEVLNESMYGGFAIALQVSMLICAGLAVLGTIFSWFRGPEPNIPEEGDDT